jgi:N-acetylneuraminic acid mutarotase
MVVIILPALHFPTAQAATGEENSWSSLAPMPTPRGELGIAVVYGKIYAMGGVNENGALNTNEEYDPSTDRWTTKTPMTTARSGFAIAVYENKIYVIGGIVENHLIANTEVYDPVTDRWETRSSMPTPRADLCANVVNNKIYLIGGKKFSSTSPYYYQTDENEVYDPATDRWTRNASLPNAVQGYASTVIGNKIYILGGAKQSFFKNGVDVSTNANFVYDAQSDNWTIAANMPTAASYGTAEATLGFMAPSRIYYIGGFAVNSFADKTYVYDPENNDWTNGTSMPTPRGYLGLTAIDDVLFAIGGYNGEKWLDTNEQYKPIGYGKVPPIVKIVTPENKTYIETKLAFNINRVTSWVGYCLDNQANVTITGKELKFNALPDGQHSVLIYANDTLGNMGYSNTVYFSIDTIGPQIVILLPKNQSYGSTDIQLTFTVNEAAQKLSYSLDGQEAVDIIGNVTLPPLTDGPHSLTVYATDDVGNNSFSDTTHFIIAPFPTLWIAAVIATIIIAVASGYLFVKRRKLLNS